jgi:hypothetical protein
MSIGRGLGNAPWQACLTAAVAALISAAPAHAQAMRGGDPPEIVKARADLGKYQDPLVAVRDGYFSTVACVEFPTSGGEGAMAYQAGGMGVHFLNASLIGPTLDPAKPQVLIYEPVGDKLRLVAAEWFVPVAVSKAPPAVLGRSLEGPMEGHQPIMPQALHHWDLHVWLWKDNPSGMFSPTNPNLKCPKSGYSFAGDAPRMVH